MTTRQMLVAGGVLGCLAVVLGAFGAHWLKGAVEEWELSEADQVKRLETWEVAVRYQMYHALALLLAGLIAMNSKNSGLRWVGILFVAGVLIFSGCLYAYVLTGVKVLGAIVPIGGTALIIGWALLTKAVWSLSLDDLK